MDEYEENCRATLAWRLLHALKDEGVISERVFYDLRFPASDVVDGALQEMRA